VQAITSNAQSSVGLARDLSTLFHRVMADGDLLRFIDEVDLSLSQFKTLGMLSEADDELTLKEVAEAMGLSLPAASRAVDGMCQRGYVERREDEVDRRMKRVRIAPAGAEAMDRIRSARIDVITRFLETLPAADHQRLAKAIAPVLERAKVQR
jgi:DNA-binding MarR family transcriptional regulator